MSLLLSLPYPGSSRCLPRLSHRMAPHRGWQRLPEAEGRKRGRGRRRDLASEPGANPRQRENWQLVDSGKKDIREGSALKTSPSDLSHFASSGTNCSVQGADLRGFWGSTFLTWPFPAALGTAWMAAARARPQQPSPGKSETVPLPQPLREPLRRSMGSASPPQGPSTGQDPQGLIRRWGLSSWIL